MVALKRVNGALVRANAGIEKGQWGRWSGSMGVAMGALVKVNGGIDQQWGLNGKIEAIVGQGQLGY